MSVNPESVKELLSSENFGDRVRGVNQLRQLEPAIAFELVQPLVTDSNTRVRYGAVSQMDTLGHQNLETALTILRDRLFNDEEPDVQAAAADALGALKLKEAFEDLQNLYHSTPEWLVKFSIIAALGELGDPRSFELLEDAIASDNELVQTAAIGSLGELGDARAIPLIVPYATHSDWQIRYRVVQALKRLGGSQAQSTLETLTKDSVEQVAKEAKASLA
ncbi:MAG: HEAT repeat domain-containing protein [Aphanothece sp. CMT-3BRIN-NPC111]|jgi:HEAT repeat protein|nr:HEAT repeat domain-containing protein [Aphanothece sp. CMT-3BRIN-NPC111]